MANENTKGRGLLKTLLGVRPEATEKMSSPSSTVPDSYGHMVRANEQLFAKLAEKEAVIAGLKRDVATADATREQAAHDLETERGKCGKAERELANANKTLEDKNRIIGLQRARIEALERHLKQMRSKDVVQIVHEHFDRAIQSLASLMLVFQRITGKSFLELQQEASPEDPTELERVSAELADQIIESTRPVASVPPPPLMPRASRDASSRSPRPHDENDVDSAENPGRVTIGFENLDPDRPRH